MLNMTLRPEGLTRAAAVFAELIRRGRDTEPLMDNIGQTLGESAVHRLAVTNTAPDGTSWPTSARARAQGGPTQYDGGQRGLAGSITHRASADSTVVGSGLPYAAMRQFGGTILPRKGDFLVFPELDSAGKPAFDEKGKPILIFARKVVQPARPYLGISDDDADEIVGLAEDYLALPVEEGGR